MYLSNNMIATCIVRVGPSPLSAVPGHSKHLPLSHKLFSMEVVDSILGIPVIAKLDKAESVLEGDLTESAVAFEEGFDITVGGISGETTQVHTS